MRKFNDALQNAMRKPDTYMLLLSAFALLLVPFAICGWEQQVTSTTAFVPPPGGVPAREAVADTFNDGFNVASIMIIFITSGASLNFIFGQVRAKLRTKRQESPADD